MLARTAIMCEPQFGLFSERMSELLCAAREVAVTIDKVLPSRESVAASVGGDARHVHPKRPCDESAEGASIVDAGDAGDDVFRADETEERQCGRRESSGSGGDNANTGAAVGGGDERVVVVTSAAKDPTTLDLDMFAAGSTFDEHRVILRGGPIQVWCILWLSAITGHEGCGLFSLLR